jgi:uncharacterized DUF497 family protein
MNDDLIYLGRYIWSRRKAALNIANHRIRFEDAVQVFGDPFATDDYDDMHSAGEDRWLVTGKIGLSCFTVSYTVRGDLVRIISAFEADPEDEEAYIENAKRYLGTR